MNAVFRGRQHLVSTRMLSSQEGVEKWQVKFYGNNASFPMFFIVIRISSELLKHLTKKFSDKKF